MTDAIFEPRDSEEILTDLVARVVARSPLTDVSEGSALLTVLGTVAEEIASNERKIKGVREAYWLRRAKGARLDARLRDLPGTGLGREGAAPASGTGCLVTRDDTVGELLVEGAVFGRSDSGDVLYIAEDFTIPDGQATYPVGGDDPIRVTASATGLETNAPAGSIDTVVSAPPEITIVTNAQAIGGGMDGEDDGEAVQRGLDYMAGLAHVQGPALRALAKAFTDSTGRRLRHAFVWESPTRPAYSELVVDDGDGLVGYEKEGVATTGVVPVGDDALKQTLIYHEAPAKDPITGAQFLIDGVPADESKYVSIPERGLIYVTDNTLMDAGATWTISGYTVYSGPIRELQKVVESDPALAAVFDAAGYRPSGGRCRVLPPDVEYISSLDMIIVFTDGSNLSDERDRVIDECVNYGRTVPPGKPFVLYDLGCKLKTLDTVQNVHFTAPVDDWYPVSTRGAVRVKAADIEVS